MLLAKRLALAVSVVLLFATFSSAQTVDEIVGKTIAAQKLDKLASVQSIRMTGTMTITIPGQPAIEGPITLEEKRPNMARMTLSLMGTENIQAYDGKTGWSVMPIQQKPTPEVATGDQLKDLQEQADIDGPLVGYKTKGHKIELVGKEPVQGADTYKLKLTLKNGDEQYQYIDAQTFLPIKMESMRDIQGTQTKTETFVSDYRDEGGVLMPHTMEVQVMGVTQKLVVQKVEMNPPLDDAKFKMPVGKQ